MGLSSSWDENAFELPKDGELSSYTGTLHKVTYSAPAKLPTLVELIVFHKKEGVHYGYLRYGLHEWEERLKPYLNHEVTIFVGENQQIWGVDVERESILKAGEIEQRLQGMKQAQKAMADNIIYVGFMMVMLWLFLFRKQNSPVQKVYS